MIFFVLNVAALVGLHLWLLFKGFEKHATLEYFKSWHNGRDPKRTSKSKPKAQKPSRQNAPPGWEDQPQLTDHTETTFDNFLELEENVDGLAKEFTSEKVRCCFKGQWTSAGAGEPPMWVQSACPSVEVDGVKTIEFPSRYKHPRVCFRAQHPELYFNQKCAVCTDSSTECWRPRTYAIGYRIQTKDAPTLTEAEGRRGSRRGKIAPVE